MESVSSVGWLGNYKVTNPVPMPARNEYLTALTNDAGFLHLVLVDTDANTTEWLTAGNFEVGIQSFSLTVSPDYKIV